ncbi:SDR family oxidoreductase [Pseudomaricurvus alkylphenolicus]|jgi:3-oxoacyl-[acyl-carrier protein] reductase|uniref:SDR family NAD(P)-dependent oxidoreductase n=1 Tax=Pseudomaricurvus alkylphenolicus TaxID=1306991 RepID=UPI00142169C1|nr:SDR family oxidoreductase [Pseudomaricurvus alkylphenolicus]NIB39892.1 SDR family oxidoreductase [Pseudomaricurvus alkylphenolicus]
MAQLQGQVAVVTGAGHPRGIGYAIAASLARQGADVAITDLPSSADLFESAKSIENLGVGSLALPCDVTDSAQVQETMARVVERFGRIDVLVNNAGVGVGSADFLELTDNDWELSLGVNLRGVVNGCRSVIPTMQAQGGGRIINIASLAGLGAIEAIPACYTASKFAVIGLTKQLASNYARDKILCNAVCPGSIVTQMHEQTLELIAEQEGISLEQAQQREDAHIPMGYSAQPAQVADAVSYLAGPSASYITGITLPVAGGMSPGL